MSKANDRQVAGSHYSGELQHWDIVVARNWDYFQAQITRYLDRWKKKNGIEDLEKARHYLEKYIELAMSGELPDFKSAYPKMQMAEDEIHSPSCCCPQCVNDARK